MKQLLKEFRAFAVKGSVLDLAVGVIIGGVFGKIVSSLVNDVIMPPIGLVLNGIDFKNLKWILRQNPDGTMISVNYGNFLQTLVEFIIISFCVFLLVRLLMKLQKRFQEEQKQQEKISPPAPSEEVLVLRDIRDSLKKVIR